MSTINSQTHFTPEDLLLLPDSVNYELVDGNLVERNMGMESSLIALRIGTKLNQFLDENPIGFAFGADASYRCFSDVPDKIRKPDVSFIRKGRLPNDTIPKGHCPIPPDLAIEVLSPGDLAYDVEEKVGEYLRAGVLQVWVVTPNSRTVRIYRPESLPAGRKGSELTVNDTISGGEVLPGFSCPVKDLFG